MNPKKERKKSSSKFYREGPPLNWPINSRRFNRIRSTQNTPLLLIPQIISLMNHLETKTFTSRIHFHELYEIIGTEIPPIAYHSKEWWRKNEASTHWNTQWTIRRIHKNDYIEFEQLLQI